MKAIKVFDDDTSHFYRYCRKAEKAGLWTTAENSPHRQTRNSLILSEIFFSGISPTVCNFSHVGCG